MKARMVVGFAFYPGSSVYLIRKNRPKWQKGKLNGIGGHVEDGETSLEAMQREFKEEAGLDLSDWKYICKMGGDDWDLDVFATILSARDEPQSMTDEKIELHNLRDLVSAETIPNTNFLVHMAWEHMNNPYSFKKAEFVY
jgi:8-oxo-dGTP diphosphatase